MSGKIIACSAVIDSRRRSLRNYTVPVHSGLLDVSFRLRKQLIKVLIILIRLIDTRA